MHTIIIANGSAPSRELLNKELTNAQHIICADGGANIAFKYDIFPHHIIGDFDSIKSAPLSLFKERNVNIERHPTTKDLTDTALALQKAIQLGSKTLTILGATGKRLDHFLGNLGLLHKAAQNGVKAQIKDDEHTIELLTESTTINGKNGATFSLGVYSDSVKGLSISGSKYELKDHDLTKGAGLTLSNEFLDKDVEISFKEGALLLVRCH